MELTAKQKWVYQYLLNKKETFVSPTEIGCAYDRERYGNPRIQPNSNTHSAWASPICKSLVSLGLVMRSPKGQYTIDESKTSADSIRQADNEARGYFRVAVLENGCEIYKKRNSAGGWSYYGQSAGVFGLIWNESVGTAADLVAVAKECYGLVLVPGGQPVQPLLLSYKFEEGNTIFYMKDNLVHSARVLSRKQLANKVNLYTTCHGEFPETSVFGSKEELLKAL